MSAWNPPPPALPLSAHELHVWQVALTQPAATIQHLRSTLSPDELARADRLHFERDRRRFIVARGVLRRLLGAYVQQPPDQIIFNYNAYGKPISSGSVHFNVAHSHELALFAFTTEAPVGIDVEYLQRVVSDRDRLAERFFAPEENEVYRALPEAEKSAAFLRCWTRKEAYIKAIGTGLSHPLDRFVVSLAPDQPAALLSCVDDPRAAQRWSLIHLEPRSDYLGAAALESRSVQLVCWSWSDEGS
jgi:4'-phosphopantetheinyl transferase